MPLNDVKEPKDDLQISTLRSTEKATCGARSSPTICYKILLYSSYTSRLSENSFTDKGCKILTNHCNVLNCLICKGCNRIPRQPVKTPQLIYTMQRHQALLSKTWIPPLSAQCSMSMNHRVRAGIFQI